MNHYILLNDDHTQIINNIYIDDETSVTLVVANPVNLIKIDPGFHWDSTSKTVQAIPESSKHDQEKRQSVIDAAILEYENAKQAALDAALDTFAQNYTPPV